MQKLQPNERIDELVRVRKAIEAQIIGQQDGIGAFVRLWTRQVGQMAPPQAPIGSMLFAGPTGVGKTATAYAIAGAVGSGVLRVDCGEYQQAHEVARLIGAPPGYLGFREDGAGAILTQDRLRATGSPAIVLFDEIEKAHHALVELLLGVLDYGVLTTGSTKEVSFTDTMIVFTSNAATEMLVAGQGGFGFAGHLPYGNVRRVLEKTLSAPFMGRIDEVVVFQPLTRLEAAQVVRLEIAKIADRASIEWVDDDERPIERVLDQAYTMRFGVRDLQRVLGACVVEPLARLRARGALPAGSRIALRAGPDGLEFWLAAQQAHAEGTTT